MIYEIATLYVRKERIELFKRAFADVTPLLVRAKGYGGHTLAQGIEKFEIFNLIVRWQSLDNHKGFEASKDHQTFISCLQEHFSEDPTVYHIKTISSATGKEGEPERNSGIDNPNFFM